MQRGQALDQRAVELGIATRELGMFGDRRDRRRERAERRLVERQPDRVRRQRGHGRERSSPGGQLESGEVLRVIAV